MRYTYHRRREKHSAPAPSKKLKDRSFLDIVFYNMLSELYGWFNPALCSTIASYSFMLCEDGNYPVAIQIL
jgi:hypothetical protein